MEDHEAFVTTEGITKQFSGVTVLRDIDIRFARGEVHAVIGENGAGKSTLMKIIAGVHQPTRGRISIDGEETALRNPHDAIEKKIALIHQEPLIFSDLDVAENIFAGHTRKDYRRFIRWRDIYDRAQELLDSLGVELSPKAKMMNMSIADQQMVEIVSALSQNAELIIMDEPTASLTPGEVGKLFAIVRTLKDQGKSFVFISHRLEEVLEIADKVTVLRDGNFIGTRNVNEVTKESLIEMMIGREMKEHIHREKTERGETLLELRSLSASGVFQDVSLSVKAGEIVGMAGLVGAGRSEVARAVFGLDPYDSGEIYLYGQPVRIGQPRDAISRHLIYVPEDRQYEGLFLPSPIAMNMTSAVPRRISRHGFINREIEDSLCEEYSRLLSVRMRDGRQAVRELSGGNQQKVVIAKWLLPDPRILILDEPTRGIDVGAKEEVYRIINELASQGKAILMISSELPEIVSLSDRVVVMKEGRVSGVFEGEQINDNTIMSAAIQGSTGGTN